VIVVGALVIISALGFAALEARHRRRERAIVRNRLGCSLDDYNRAAARRRRNAQ
jgi:hypothetical protein